MRGLGYDLEWGEVPGSRLRRCLRYTALSDGEESRDLGNPSCRTGPTPYAQHEERVALDAWEHATGLTSGY
jgi:hypothetical protein